MSKVTCKPRDDGYFFLIACILFSACFLFTLAITLGNSVPYFGMYSLSFFIPQYIGLPFFAAIMILFFLSYTKKIDVFIPFLLIAVNMLRCFIEGSFGFDGFFGFLNTAASIFAVLCLLGIVDFSFNAGIPEKIKSKANDPCILAAAIFVVLGIISVIRVAVWLTYGVSFLFLLRNLCLFAGAALAMYSIEAVKNETKKQPQGHSYEEAVDLAKNDKKQNSFNAANMQAGGSVAYKETKSQANSDTDDVVKKLKELAELRDLQILTEEEFVALKTELLKKV